MKSGEALYTGYRDKEKRKAYNRKYQRKYMKKWRRQAPEMERARLRRYSQKLRKRVLDALGGPRCVNCGCNQEVILEINHKNGGGRAHMRKNHQRKFYVDLANGRVDKSEYEVLCRVCNALHYVSVILKIKGHQVHWSLK